MKLCLFLLALIPLAYCTMKEETDASVDEKRFLEKIGVHLDGHRLNHLKDKICEFLKKDKGKTCKAVCPTVASALPLSNLFKPLCGPACKSLHCASG